MTPLENIIHRVSTLKQKNKKHKTLGHRTKGQIANKFKGRTNSSVNLKSVQNHVISKEERLNKAKQIMRIKRVETLIKKKSRGSIADSSPAHLICVIPLYDDADSDQFLKLLESQTSCSFSRSSQGLLHLVNTRLKSKYSFVVPPSNDLYSILDTVKVSDTVLFLWQLGNSLDEKKLDLISSINHQAMPSTVHAIVGDIDIGQKKKLRYLKELKITLESLFLKSDKIHNINESKEILLLLRQISSQKMTDISFRDRRTHIIAEKVDFTGDSCTGTLILEGYIRGKSLTPEALMHIPGCESYQLENVQWMPDPHYTVSPTDLETLIVPDPKMQQSLNSIVEQYDEFASRRNEQETNDSNCSESVKSNNEAMVDEAVQKPSSRRLPKGTSDYQAAWLFSDDDDSISDSEVEVDVEDDIDESLSEEDYDKHYRQETEMEDWKIFKAATDDIDFTDEVDTPIDVSAREFFKDFRGLESFRTSPWNPHENLPQEYQRICHFPNFRHLSNKNQTVASEQLKCGSYVVIRLKDFPRHHYEQRMKDQSPFVAFSLLKYEQKMSVVNILLKSCHNRSIQSGDRLIFHAGISRFENNPIFSEHTNNNKHKMARFLHPGQFVIATMYAPVLHSPCPVTVYQKRLDGSQVMVASGSVFSVNANRIICERVVLTGHAFKVHKKSVVVRFMFFNSDDVNFFKSIKVETEFGNKGHIIGSIGSHGHMKVKFKNQMKLQSGVVSMKLFRRVFPTWSFEPIVEKSISEDSQPPIFHLFERTKKKVRFR